MGREMLLDLPSDHDAVLERMARRGIAFDTFFDVGAARGLFGEKVVQHWPQAEIVFFEAAPYWEKPLQAMCAKLGRATAEFAAVGPQDSRCYFRFDEKNPMGGAILPDFAEGCLEIPMVSLDSYVATRNVGGRFALKLDVHGAEQAILAGAGEFMKRCELIIFETYNFGPAHRRFGQMAVLLEERFGMRCIDIAEPKWRPYDQALWQMDCYFGRFEGTTLSEWRLT